MKHKDSTDMNATKSLPINSNECHIMANWQGYGRQDFGSHNMGDSPT
jgi:hypothetical protein